MKINSHYQDSKKDGMFKYIYFRNTKNKGKMHSSSHDQNNLSERHVG